MAGRYRVEQFIARGGMGEVYRAEDLELAVPVALKTVRSEIASSHEALRRFKQEVILARSVSHANVCRIYDIGRHSHEDRQITFLTMELLLGETLESLIARSGALAPGFVLPIARQIADALDAAHHAGIVHRDLKSSNIFVVGDQAERAVVTDFGLAFSWPDQPASDSGRLVGRQESVVGTPEYMAPEQLRGERPGPPADRYALGILLFEMITGRLPFLGDTRAQIANARLHEDPPSPSEFADVGSSWDAVVSRLLSRDPRQRFSTAGEAVGILEGVGSSVLSPHTIATHSLPAERDRFVGRQQELVALHHALEQESALVTLLGPGGVGKTRLARHYAWSHRKEWPEGVWFCDLADAGDSGDIVRLLASTLQIPLGRKDHVGQLFHALRSLGRALVIFDNFEQVREHAGTTIGHWAKAAGGVSFLVTSRERLAIDGETVHDLRSLSLEDDAVDLFVERARAQRPDLPFGDRDHELIRDIVSALDGTPLAIEMAAARLRVLSLQQLHDRLRERLPWLTSSKSGRHGSMRAVLQSSWEAMRAWEQSAALQAAVFQGGFDLEAAEAVFDLSQWSEAPSTLDVLQQLIDKSWLFVDSPDGDPRFGMYALIREFLVLVGEQSDSPPSRSHGRTSRVDPTDQPTMAAPSVMAPAQQRHAAHFADFGEMYFTNKATGLSRPEADDRLRAERANLLAACRHGIGTEDVPVARKTLEAFWRVLQDSGPFSLGVELGRLAKAIPGADPRNRAHISIALASALWRAGEIADAEREFSRALQACRKAGSWRGEAVVISHLGNLDRLHGRRAESLEKHKASLAIHRENKNVNGEAVESCNIGIVLSVSGRNDEAASYLERALSIHRETGDRGLEANVLNSLGIVHDEQGREVEARAHYEAAATICRELGNLRLLGIVLGNLSILHGERGQLTEAEANLTEALALHRKVGNRQEEGVTLFNRGHLRGGQGNIKDGRSDYETALEIHREMGNVTEEASVLRALALLDIQLGGVGEARESLKASLDILQTTEDPSHESSSLETLGYLQIFEGAYEDARSSLLKSKQLAERVKEPIRVGKVMLALAYLDHKEGKLDEALTVYQTGLELLREQTFPRGEAGALCGLGLIHAEQGRHAEAEEVLTQAEEIFRRLGDTYYLADTLVSRGRAHFLRGDRPSAEACLEEAQTLVERMGISAGPVGKGAQDLRRDLDIAP